MSVTDDMEEKGWSGAMVVARCGGRECIGCSSCLNPHNNLRLYISVKHCDNMSTTGVEPE